MQRIDDAGRAGPLILELASGTARLHGEELELPLREFRLLAALAARVGEPVSSKALIEAVWGEEAEWTAPENLTVLVSKLRRLIDGPDKFGKHIRNRRGFGYLLDLEPDQLVVIDRDAVEPTPITIDLRDEESDPVEPETPPGEPAVVTTAPRSRMFRPVAVMGLVVALLAASWGTGYLVSRRTQGQTQVTQSSDDSRSTDPQANTDEQVTKRPRPADRREGKKSSRKRQHGNRQQASGQPVVVAAPQSGDVPTANNAPTGSTQGSRKGSDHKKPAPPPLPPAPTRYLYHLVNQQTGDHFVTTDGNTASEYEAKGYQGGAIGRIYSYQEEGTRAVTTDAGTAYVFISSGPKTEPASRVLPLWYSTNNDGDFFYTTNEAEAKQDGWSGSLIGYVRTL